MPDHHESHARDDRGFAMGCDGKARTSAALRYDSTRFRRVLFSLLVACIVCVGLLTHAAFAQAGIPGTADTTCVKRCVESGQESEYCDKLCWVPDLPVRVQPAEMTDAGCLRTCRKQGGRYSECKPRCRMPEAN
jgi:hypothetical protein